MKRYLLCKNAFLFSRRFLICKLKIKPMPRKKVSVEPIEKIWLSTKEFAEYIGMSTGYIHDLRKSGQIHHYMIGNTAFFKKSDVDELIEGHKVC